MKDFFSFGGLGILYIGVLLTKIYEKNATLPQWGQDAGTVPLLAAASHLIQYCLATNPPPQHLSPFQGHGDTAATCWTGEAGIETTGGLSS